MQCYILKSLYGKVNGKDFKSVNGLFPACKRYCLIQHHILWFSTGTTTNSLPTTRSPLTIASPPTLTTKSLQCQELTTSSLWCQKLTTKAPQQQCPGAHTVGRHPERVWEQPSMSRRDQDRSPRANPSISAISSQKHPISFQNRSLPLNTFVPRTKPPVRYIDFLLLFDV